MSFAWCAFIVPVPDDEVFARVKERDPSAIALPGGFACVDYDSWPDCWTEAGSSIKWSEAFGEAWLLAAISSATNFAYEHSHSGQVLRALGFSGDEGWLVVEGEPEDWETVMFDETQIAIAKDNIQDNPNEPHWVDELEALQARQIVKGYMLPVADPTLVELIAKNLGTELIDS